MIEVFSRRNASDVLSVMWTIGELGIEYVQHDIGGAVGGMDLSEFPATDPSRNISIIVKDRDFVLWETNAILRYLCRRYDHNRCLLPRSDEHSALGEQWMDWYKTALYPQYLDLTWSIVRTNPTTRDFERISLLQSATEEALAILTYHLSGCKYLLGDYFSVADVPFGVLYFLYLNLDIDRPKFKGMNAWYSRVCQRPAFIEQVILSVPR